jgi:hypothetical protein
MKIQLTGVLVVAAVAFAVLLGLGFVSSLRLPSVVLKLVAGVLIGSVVLGLVEIDAPMRILSLFMLAFLLSLAGLKADDDLGQEEANDEQQNGRSHQQSEAAHAGYLRVLQSVQPADTARVQGTEVAHLSLLLMCSSNSSLSFSTLSASSCNLSSLSFFCAKVL